MPRADFLHAGLPISLPIICHLLQGCRILSASVANVGLDEAGHHDVQRGTLGASFTDGANTRLQRSRPVLRIDRSQLQNGQPRVQEPDSLSADDSMQNGKQ